MPRRCRRPSRSCRRSCGAIDETCSRFRDDSELALLNRSAGAPFASSPLLLEALAVALLAAARTDGDVDPTVGRSLGALGWDSRLHGRGRAPRPGAAHAHRPRRRLATRAPRSRARTGAHPGGSRDRSRRHRQGARRRSLCARACTTATGASALVNLGGDIALAGPAPAGGWPIRVTDDHRSAATADGSDDRPRRRRPRHVEHHRAPLACRRRRAASHRRSAHRSPGAPRSGDRQRGRRHLRRGQLGQHRGDRARREGAWPGSRGPACPARLVRRDGATTLHLRVARGGGGVSSVLTSGPVWYLMRGSGVVSLLLLTAVSALGIATVSRWRPGRVPRFVTLGLHRNISLLAVAFLSVHVLTAVIDPQASVSAVAVVVPAPVGPLRALARTCRARARSRGGAGGHEPAPTPPSACASGARVHWLAYLAWPVALLHGAGMGTDAGSSWMLAVDAACIAIFARRGRAAAAERARGGGQAPRAADAAGRADERRRDARDRVPAAPAPAAAGGRAAVARRARRALRRPPSPARRGDGADRGGRGERAARTRRRRLPDAPQAARGRGAARSPIVVANGVEGEPASHKDSAAHARQSAPRARRRRGGGRGAWARARS